MEQKANQYQEPEPVGILMRKYALPCIISLLVARLYNIVDQIFIAVSSCYFLTPGASVIRGVILRAGS